MLSWQESINTPRIPKAQEKTMIILGMPVLNQKKMTQEAVASLARTVGDPKNFRLVIIDNNSSEPYWPHDFDVPFSLAVMELPENQGYYLPLSELANYADHINTDLVGLVHNDVIFYEDNWDIRLRQEFEKDKKLGLVGLAGSNEVDEEGGRGAGTMCHFKGLRGQPQGTYIRISDLQPALLLDSLFMMFRAKAIDDLKITDDISIHHFYDKIWSLRMIASGWRVGVLGVEIDHVGGQTSIGETRYLKDAIQWLKKQGISASKSEADLLVYREGERRFFAEFKDGDIPLIPSRINADWKITK